MCYEGVEVKSLTLVDITSLSLHRLNMSYNQQKRVGEFDKSKNSFLECHLRAFTPHGFLAVLNMFCDF